MRFDEKGIGYTETLTTRVETISDEDFLNGLKGFREGTRVRTERSNVELGRMIMIYGAPNKGAARIVFNQGSSKPIPNKGYF